MRDFFKSKVITGLVVIATIILAGVAIFTAWRLYQLRSESVAPTAPESQPAAVQPTPTPKACGQLVFTISTPTPTITGTPTPTATGTLTPTPTSTPTSTPTNTPGPTNTPTEGPTPTDGPTSTPTDGPTSTPGPTATPTTGQIAQVSPSPDGAALPDAGVSLPTIFGFGLGILLIILALVLAI